MSGTAGDYDAVYRGSREYRLPYRESFYYALWQQALKLLPANKQARILELGCGPGQFAAMLRDAGYTRYTGIDFSPVAVGLAQASGQRVLCADAFQYLAGHDDYDVVIALEVFEHLDDRRLLGLVKPGTMVIFSVPNFAHSRHLRHFATGNKVRQHYGGLLTISYLTRALQHGGQRWYLAQAERPRPVILAAMMAYNELDYLPLKLAWCRRNGFKMYVVDNYSTDGTWEWLQANHIRSHRVDTKGAFDLAVLQGALVPVIRHLKPDWVIYQGVDLFFETDRPLAWAIAQADAEGYNLLQMRVIGLFNTGEQAKRFDPFRTFFYMGKGRQVALIHKATGFLGYHGDAILMSKPSTKRLPGVIVNMGMTKPAAEREETYHRRVLAWQRGLRAGFGKHYQDGHALGWVWPRSQVIDIRHTAYWPYYQRLQDLR